MTAGQRRAARRPNSPGLREEFGNGEQFYERARHPIALPSRRADRPSSEFLEWHLDTIFRAS